MNCRSPSKILKRRQILNEISNTPYNVTQPLKPLNLLTINLEDESFHNSIEWSGPYLQVNIPPWFETFFRFRVQIAGKYIL